MGKFVREVVQNDEVDETPEQEEQETVRPVSPLRRGGMTRAIDTGWDEPKRDVVKSDNLILADRGKIIVKLLQSTPVKYFRHYVRSAGPKGKYFTCTREPDCPLCEKGVRASVTYMLNVVDMNANSDTTKVITWTFGNEVATSLQSLTETPRGDDWPIDADDHYFQVYHEKIANRDAPATRVHNVSAKYLEDYGLEPLSEVELEDLKADLFDASSVFLNSHESLMQVRVLPTDLPQKRK